MTEPSSSIPEDIANAGAEADEATSQPESSPVKLNVDEEKLDAWDRIKSDYETEPDGQPVPNSMDQAQSDAAEADEHDETDETQEVDLGGVAADGASEPESHQE